MLTPAIDSDETDRLAELEKLELMYSLPEDVFDRVTAKLAEAFDAPAVMMNVIDHDNQYVKSIGGLPADALESRVMPRQMSLCNHVVTTNEALVVEDLAADERFRDNPMVKAKGLRFYAGAPLHSENGQAMGSLCVVDFKPRTISDRERRLLKMLADSLMTEVKLRTASSQLLARTKTMERDLVAARNVQRFLLPPNVQEREGFAVWHSYHPFDAIGGDFLDAVVRHDGALATLLADVSGHGPSAALTSAMVKTTFQRAAGAVENPARILTSLQRDLGAAVESGQFITAIASVFDPLSKSVMVASAGHPFPIHIRGGRASVVHVANELPLLIDSAQTYVDQTMVSMDKGDRLLFYTDGATEAADEAGAMLEVQGLMAMVQTHAHLPGAEFLRLLFQAVRGFAAGRLRDDVALVCLEAK